MSHDAAWTVNSIIIFVSGFVIGWLYGRRK
jgi:hypothetical protein